MRECVFPTNGAVFATPAKRSKGLAAGFAWIASLLGGRTAPVRTIALSRFGFHTVTRPKSHHLKKR